MLLGLSGMGWYRAGIHTYMFTQERLIDAVDVVLSGKHRRHYYARFCGYLRLEDLFTTDAVAACASRCASGFMHKRDTQEFMRAQWMNSYLLKEEVLSGRFVPRYYASRYIIERGKERLIRPPTFKCKVVQKVLCDYLIRPLLEPRMVSTNYASIKGRGCAAMHEDICRALNNTVRRGSDYAVIIYDYKSYFASIDTKRLFRMLGRYIRDERILSLMEAFSPEGEGLSLGNELSQVPASYYPSPIDHYYKDRMGIQHFRYMDDTLQIVHPDMVRECIEIFRRESDKLGLVCPDDKIHIYAAREPFIYCKERYVWNRNKGLYDHLINPKTVGNEQRKLHSFVTLRQSRRISKEIIQAQADGVIGAINSHPHTRKDVARLRSMEQVALQ